MVVLDTPLAMWYSLEKVGCLVHPASWIQVVKRSPSDNLRTNIRHYDINLKTISRATCDLIINVIHENFEEKANL